MAKKKPKPRKTAPAKSKGKKPAVKVSSAKKSKPRKTSPVKSKSKKPPVKTAPTKKKAKSVVMSSENRFTDLAALIAASQRANFGSGVPLEVIADAEQHLGLSFPPSYRWWLVEYGGGYLGGYELQGLCPEPIAERDPDIPITGDIIDVARRNADLGWYPSHLLELLNYEGDEVYFFDTQRPSQDGEWPVACIYAGTSEPREVAANFTDFLQRQLATCG